MLFPRRNPTRVCPLSCANSTARLEGARHIKFAQPTPLANLHLTLLDKVGIHLDSFGDSQGRVNELLAI